MGVTGSNLIQGPATLYLGVFGATEPLTIATAPGAPFTDVGGTNDGVELGIADEYAELTVDQVLMTIERRRTKRAVTIKTNLAEATLANLAQAISNTAPASNVLTLDEGLGLGFNPNYRCVLLDGLAPGGFRRRIILRKALSIDSVASSYKKDGMTLVPVTFAGHWVSTSIAALKIEDATA